MNKKQIELIISEIEHFINVDDFSMVLDLQIALELKLTPKARNQQLIITGINKAQNYLDNITDQSLEIGMELGF